MKLFGWEISRTVKKDYGNVPYAPNIWGSLLGPIMEPFTGAWQRNITVDSQPTLLAFSAVYACVTGIAADIAKNRIKLDIKDEDDIWTEIDWASPYYPVLRKPNHYQNRIKFVEQWIISKLLYGNTYVLKERDARGIVVAMYVLHPLCVRPLIADDGSVFYELHADKLSQVDDTIRVPASEIIHDMMVSLWHPLVGVSPIYACAMSGTMGNKIQANSTTFFDNLSRPGGMLSSPGHIDDATAQRLKTYWEQNYGGRNVGRIAVAGDGLKFEAFSIPANDAQLIDQLKWTVEDVARAFHYPNYKLGGQFPPYSSGPEALTTMYYTDCLQFLIESLELCLDEGLELPANYGTELDINNLMRMDTAALYESNNKAVVGGWMKPDEARNRANFSPVAGGDTPYMQQQNYPLASLDRPVPPTQSQLPAATPAPSMTPTAEPGDTQEEVAPKMFDREFFEDEFRKELVSQ